jgi:hypothetical protein
MFPTFGTRPPLRSRFRSGADHFPTAADLTLTVGSLELAARIGRQKLTGVEPMIGDRSSQEWREGSRKLGDLRTTPVPKRQSTGDFVEAEDLFDATVAVRGYHENTPGKARRASTEAHDHIVVKFALFPVIDEYVRSETATDLFQQRSQNECIGKLLNNVLAHVGAA